MSYPKVNKSQIKDYTDRSGKVGATKDHLKNLLINKFRVKYSNSSNVENFDTIIRTEVEHLLLKGKTTEDDLLLLDRKLQSLLASQSQKRQHSMSNTEHSFNEKSER